MYEKILVPLDGSELAEVALPYAEELAGRLGSEVTLIYVNELNKDPYQHMHQFYLQKIVEATKQGAGRYSDKSVGRQAVQIKSVILPGHPAEEIVGYTDKENISLIVMATHGQSGLKRWALGSVADKVVRATTRPVLLIRAKGARADVREKGILRKALVPLDGSKVGETAVPFIEGIASKLQAEVILLQVLARGYEVGYDYVALTERQMESDKAIATNYLNDVGIRLKKKGIAVATEVRLGIEVRAGNVADEIIKFADELQADIVAMSTHGRSGVSRRVFGSVAERVLREGDIPLLLVRAPGATGESREY
jgi:nucleotide-binding universal stress UspA family protein